MANKDNPHGFTLAGPMLSAHEYIKSTAAAIYPGDMVAFDAGGVTGGKIAVAAAGGTQLVGVALKYVAATGTTILVADDPDQTYYGQCDATTLVANANYELVATVGNATRLKSQHEIDSGAGTMASAQIRVLKIHPADAATANSRHMFVINEHVWAKKLTTVT